jgi:hypothetical protein
VNTATQVGAIQAGQVYRLRFDVTTTAPNRRIRVHLIDSQSPYASTAQSLLLPINRQVQQYEVFFPTHTSVANAQLYFELVKADQVAWLDNVELHQVTATPINPENVIRFEYNDTQVNRVITLDNVDYIDPQGNRYLAGSSLTLAPYDSVILMQVPTTDLLSNGGFEQDANDDRQPDFWRNKVIADDQIVCNKTNKVMAFAGRCALRLKGSSMPTSVFKQKFAVSGLTAPQTLVLEAYVRGKKAQVGGSIKLRVKFVDTTLPTGKVNLSLPSGSYDYTVISDNLTLADDVATIKVTLRYTGKSGWFMLDDLSLTITGTARQLANNSSLIPLPMTEPISQLETRELRDTTLGTK